MLHAEEIYERFLEPHLGANRRARAIFGRAGIKQRYTAVEGAYHHVVRGTEERNVRYMQDAVPLGTEVICKTLNRAQVSPQSIDLLTVASCTGFDIPGLDLHLAARLAMRHDLSRTYILGMGCYAAFPALRRARDAALATPGSRSLALCLELCRCTSNRERIPKMLSSLRCLAMGQRRRLSALMRQVRGRKSSTC